MLTLSPNDIVHGKYNGLDVIYTLEAANVMLQEIEDLGLTHIDFHTFQQERLNPALLRIMNRGVKIDLDKKEHLRLQLTYLIKSVNEKLEYLLGESFNPASYKQLQKICKELLGIQLIKDKKSKAESTGSQYVFQYIKQYPEYKIFLTLLLELRSLNVFLNTFVLAKVDPDGRMRTTYNCAGTKTGRLSSRKTAFSTGANLANIPSKGKIPLKYSLGVIESLEESEDEEILDTLVEVEDEEGITELPNCKEMFIPDKDFIFWNGDYSGADAQIVAFDSDCSWLKDFFKNPPLTSKGKPFKLYQYVASHYLQKEISTDDKWYKIFKQFIHGTNYGMLEHKAALNAGIPAQDAKNIRQWYINELCPEILEWHKRIESDCRSKGYVENIFGRRMWFLNKDVPTWLNQAIASIPQSTIADLTNHGLVNIEDCYAKGETSAHCLIQVHDALGGQFHKTDTNALEVIKKSMLIEIPYDDILIIPVDISYSEESYGKCK